MKLDTSPGVDVNVCVDGTPLQEYDDTDGGANEDSLKGISYVEAVPGANFTVRFQAYKPQMGGCGLDRVNLAIHMDGKCAISHVLEVHANPILESFTSKVEGIDRNVNGRFVREKFVFSTLRTDDGPLRNLLPADFKHLGEIEVICTFARARGAPKPLTSESQSKFKPASDISLPEKCLKGRAISNKCSLSEPITLREELKSQAVDYPYGTKPFARYIFKYRSRRDLQIEGIIPRSPSPVPLEARDPDNLTPEEARELVRRMRAREEDKTRIKQEASVRIKKEKRDHSTYLEDDDEEGDEDEVTITGQSKRSRLSASNDSGIEIIDLT